MSTHCKSPRLHHVLAGLLIPTALTLTACSPQVNITGELGQDQATLAACSGRLASMVSVDVSGSGRDQSIADQHVKAISAVVRRTSICGGHLKVVAFSGTSAMTRKIYDGELQLAGATDIARLRKVPALVDETMNEISKGYRVALSAPPQGNSSDITGQYRLAGEYAAQLGSGYRLNYFLLTDGFHNTGLGVIDRVLSAAAAKALAQRVSVPALKGASVTVAGLGKVAGAPPKSDMVEGLVRFYDAICARTQAAECRSVTDFTVGGE